MTIKELHDITGNNTRIFISWDGSIYELDRESVLALTAYGKFIIAQINAMGETEIEAVIKAVPATIERRAKQ